MRRIYVCVLLLGIGGLSLGLMRGLAQTSPNAPIGTHEKPIAVSPTPAKDVRRAAFEQTKSEQAKAQLPATPWADPVEIKTPQAPVLKPEIDKQPLTIPDLTAPMSSATPLSLPMLDPAAIPAPPRALPTADAPQVPKVDAPQIPKLDTPAPMTGTLPDLQFPPLPAIEPVKPNAEPKVEAKKQDPQPPLTIPATPKIDEPIKPKESDPLVIPKPTEPENPPLRFNPASIDSKSIPLAPVPTSPSNHSGPLRSVAPAVSIETIVPESVGIGQPLNYEIVVRNVGPISVQQVRIDDELPKNVRYVGGDPVAEVNGERIQWGVGALEVGAEKRVKVTVKPSEDGDWRSRPTVTFSALALPVQVRVTKPKLAVNVTVPESAAVGEEVPFNIEVSNSGTGVAHEVVLRVQLSEGLNHPEGSVIEAKLQNIAVGEKRQVPLKTQAARAGANGCVLTVAGDGVSEASARANLLVTPPTVHLKLSGPPRALVKGEPVFVLELSNTAATASQPMRVAAAFPEGLEFVSATEGASFDKENRVVAWAVEALPANTKREMAVKVRAGSNGSWAVRAVAQSAQRTEIKAESVIQVDGVPALTFEVVNLENPVEVGKDATYEIRVVNQGTVACTNLRIVVALTEGLTPTGVTAPTGHKVEGQILTFEPIAKLAVKADAVLRVRVKGASAGDHRCKVQLSCDQLKQPVVKEESTSFFSAQ